MTHDSENCVICVTVDGQLALKQVSKEFCDDISLLFLGRPDAPQIIGTT
jgi:hypothetical protein